MIGCVRTRVRKQSIIALYLESENELKFYNLEASMLAAQAQGIVLSCFCFVLFFFFKRAHFEEKVYATNINQNRPA